MNKLISVIVPIYKVEKYLKACVDSLINQTYENLEIILVDDGSPDNCPKMCDEYAIIDKRIKVIHKKNGGLSDARNAGVMIATGEYVFFVDSDDAIELDTIEWAYSKAISEKCDVVITTFKKTNNHHNIVVGNSKDMFKYIFEKSCFEAWGKLVKRSLLDNITFPKGKLYEDVGWTPYIILKANKVYYEDNGKYLYTVRDDSIMGKSKITLSSDIIEHMDNIEKYVNKEYPALYEFIHIYAMNFLLAKLRTIKGIKNDGNTKFKKDLKNYYKPYVIEFVLYKQIYWKTKIIFILFNLFNIVI